MIILLIIFWGEYLGCRKWEPFCNRWQFLFSLGKQLSLCQSSIREELLLWRGKTIYSVPHSSALMGQRTPASPSDTEYGWLGQPSLACPGACTTPKNHLHHHFTSVLTWRSGINSGSHMIRRDFWLSLHPFSRVGNHKEFLDLLNNCRSLTIPSTRFPNYLSYVRSNI